jgi:hypothetical protein
MNASNRQLLLVLGGVVLVVVVAILVRDVIGSTVVPFLLGEGWRIYSELSQLPQILLWGGIVVILITAGGVSALLSMTRVFNRETPATTRTAPDRPGRVSSLVVELDDVRRGAFFRRQLIEHLSALTVAVLEQRDQPTSREVERLLTQEKLELSSALREYLLEGRRRDNGDPAPNPVTRMQERLKWGQGGDAQAWRDPELSELVALMEQKLEVRHRDNRD